MEVVEVAGMGAYFGWFRANSKRGENTAWSSGVLEYWARRSHHSNTPALQHAATLSEPLL
jgi:hypothetical protein